MNTRGFTIIELMVALAILATILSLAAPRYLTHLDSAKENVLREDLYILRDAVDKYFADHNRYPDSLEDLVTNKYLRSVPADPLTGNAKSWILVPPANSADGGVYDVHSGAPGRARDGTFFKDW